MAPMNAREVARLNEEYQKRFNEYQQYKSAVEKNRKELESAIVASQKDPYLEDILSRQDKIIEAQQQHIRVSGEQLKVMHEQLDTAKNDITSNTRTARISIAISIIATIVALASLLHDFFPAWMPFI